MPLQLIQPWDRYVLRHTIEAEAVIGHLRSVATAYARQPGFTKFYIGVTNNLNRRLSEHQAAKPDFKLMVPIYEEWGVPAVGSFDDLERQAIHRLRDGITHPVTGARVMQCTNGKEGVAPKRLLYLLVG